MRYVNFFLISACFFFGCQKEEEKEEIIDLDQVAFMEESIEAHRFSPEDSPQEMLIREPELSF